MAERITFFLVDSLVCALWGLSVHEYVSAHASDVRKGVRGASGMAHPIPLEAVLRAKEAVYAHLLTGRALQRSRVITAICALALLLDIAGRHCRVSPPPISLSKAQWCKSRRQGFVHVEISGDIAMRKNTREQMSERRAWERREE